jgi:hypothetical protein
VLALTRDAADATNVATGRPRTVLDMARARWLTASAFAPRSA